MPGERSSELMFFSPGRSEHRLAPYDLPAILKSCTVWHPVIFPTVSICVSLSYTHTHVIKHMQPLGGCCGAGVEHNTQGLSVSVSSALGTHVGTPGISSVSLLLLKGHWCGL